MSSLSSIYHERQQEALCAVHCINNLLQGDFSNAGDLAQIAQQLDDAEEAMFSEHGKNSSDYKNYLKRGKTNVSESGDFSIQVVTEYLKIYGIELTWLHDGNPESKNVFEKPTLKKGYICNLNSHWLCLREFNSTWFKLDSTQKNPEYVSPTYLSMYLNQLKYEGYSVFSVEGKLPPCQADYLHYDPKSNSQQQQGISVSNQEEDEIQKAIQLSLQESQQNNIINLEEEDEDEEMKKAIELSLQMNSKLEKTIFLENYKKYLTTLSENSTRIQFRLPNGKKQVFTILLDAPVAVLYSIFNELLQNENKFFSVVYQERTNSKTYGFIK
eukprot:gene11168-3989_t